MSEDNTNGKKRRNDDSTIVFTDINRVLNASEIAASDRPAAFIAIGGDMNGAIFDLKDGEHSFGRQPENTFSFDLPGISRHHFTVKINGDKASIVDMGSRNGTFVNNIKLEKEIPLKKQDMVKFGNVALTFIPKGDPERLAYDKLNYQANTDGLTKCFNKAYFNNAIELEMKRSKSTGTPLSLIVYDLDHFKKLNDQFGHDAGDHVLRESSKMVKASGIRDQDIFARYGGEEFVILLPRTNIKQAYEIAERVRRIISDSEFLYESKRLPVAVSVGIADYRQGVTSSVELFKRADKALYQSKEGGRNRVSFFRD